MVELVKDYMIKKEEVVSPEDSVSSAVELMIANDIGSVVVVDDKTNEVIGIFTERDLLRRYMGSRTKFIHLRISEVMTSPVVTVTKDTKLSDAVRLMKEHDIGRVPVVDKKKQLVGILFWKDIFNRLCCKE